MSKAPDLREIFSPPDEIIQAGLNGDLVFFVGAGASMLLGLPSWGGLASLVLQDLRNNELLNYSELEQIKGLDPKKQLSIADLIAKENGYDLNIARHLQDKPEGDSIYKSINDIGCSCVTTNYDELLAPRFLETKDGSTTPVAVRKTLKNSQI